MSSMTRLFATATLLGALAACGGGTSSAPPAAPPVPKPATPPADLVGTELASVNGLPVGSKTFELLSARRAPASGTSYSIDEKKEILDDAITDEVLFQVAFERGIYQDPKVRKIMVNLLLRDEVYGTVDNEDFPDAEQRAYYEAHKEDFVVPEKIHLKRIFVAAEGEGGAAAAEAEAKEVRAKVVANPDAFRDLATEHSDGPFKRRGGDIGYVARDGKPGIPPEVVARAFELQVGEVSEPFLVGGGYNIVMVANKRERLERTFEQMRGSVLRRLKNDRYEELADKFIAAAKEGRAISIDDKALEGYQPPSPTRPGLGMPGAPGEGGEPSEINPFHEGEDGAEGDANDMARELMKQDEHEE